MSPRVFLRVVQPWSASLWLGPQARANESGAVAFMVEIVALALCLAAALLCVRQASRR